MKNIETVKLYPICDLNVIELQQYYNTPISSEFKNTAISSHGLFVFHTNKVHLELFDDNQNVYIGDIAKELNIENIEEAYHKYVPNIIRYRLEKTLPYQEAVSCNKDGIIKIVHYKKFASKITKLLKQYCYEFVSEEQFEDRNNEPVVILKYKLVIKDI